MFISLKRILELPASRAAAKFHAGTRVLATAQMAGLPAQHMAAQIGRANAEPGANVIE